MVEPPIADLPEDGPWASTRSAKWSGIEEDVFGSWDDGMVQRRGGNDKAKARNTRSLSELLDNVVILEECVKELAGVIEARGCLGIDPIW